MVEELNKATHVRPCTATSNGNNSIHYADHEASKSINIFKSTKAHGSRATQCKGIHFIRRQDLRTAKRNVD